MPDYRFSRRAALDLEAIAEYTIERFGLEQARRYRDELGSPPFLWTALKSPLVQVRK